MRNHCKGIQQAAGRDFHYNAHHCPTHKKPRAYDIDAIETIKAKWADAVVRGHPDMFFQPIFRISSKEADFFRSLDVCPVRGGGLIVQSSWYENGRPALGFRYESELAVVREKYVDENGAECDGFVIVKEDRE